MTNLYLGLGSNLEKRRDNIKLAVSRLIDNGLISVTALSDLFTTKPYGGIEQSDFLNCCLSGTSSLQPIELLNNIKAIELEIGRKKTIRWGPRLIDIDILIYEGRNIQSKALTIPHVDMLNRNFVVFPLLQIMPNSAQLYASLNAAAKKLRRPDIFESWSNNMLNTIIE